MARRRRPPARRSGCVNVACVVASLFAAPASVAAPRDATAATAPRDATAPTTPRIGDSARALRVIAREVTVLAEPNSHAPRRGTLARGADALVHARRRGEGCKGDWLLIGPAAWACEDPLDFALGKLVERRQIDPPPSPHRVLEFVRIGPRGALGYGSVDRAEQQLPDAELQPGFFVAIVEERSLGGERFVRTTHDVWLARRELATVVPSAFEGVELDAAHGADATLGTVAASTADPELLGSLPIGWVFVERTSPRKALAGAKLAKPVLTRLARLRVHELQRSRDGHEWYRTDEGWLSDQQLRVPRATLPPAGIAENERWLDVDKRTQTLVAYVGRTPVFATLVSTGRGPEGSTTSTPSGVHRIWVKLAATDMDNLDEQDAERELVSTLELYAVEAVPFVMFFARGYGLHATYWHDAFGTPKSHGCVNLSLRDAERLFEFSSPKLAPGWQAVHPYDHDPGTVVRVR